jgi:hypothetical protein
MEAARSIPRSRRRFTRHLACGLGVCGLTAALLALPGSPASGAVVGEPAVVVEGPHGALSGFDGKQIEGAYDVEARTATLRANAGEAGERIGIPAGLSVRRLIELSGAEPEAVGYLTVPRPGGSVAYLPAAEFSEPPPSADGPATVWIDQGCTRFFRPALGSAANAEDNIASCGAPLAIGVRGGDLLTVEASASPATATVGTAVEFTAGAIGGLSGEGILFRWRFGDGASAEGARVDHAFAATGSYRVTVAAVGSEESGGESAPVTVVVGSPPAGPGVGAGPEAPKKKTRPRGTGRRKGTGANGGGRSGSGAKGSGGGKGGSGADSRKGDGENGAGGGGGRSDGIGGGSASVGGSGGGGDETGPADESRPATEPSPVPEPLSIPEPPPSEASPFSEAPLPPGATARPESTPPSPAAGVPPPARAAAPVGSPAAAAPSPGQIVRGQLAADLFEPGSIAPGSPGSDATPASESFASAPPSSSGSVPVVALIAAALLAGGIGFEWRRRPYQGQR